MSINKQLQAFDLKEGKLEASSLTQNLNQTLSSNIAAMTFSEIGNLWIALDKTLIEYNPGKSYQ